MNRLDDTVNDPVGGRSIQWMRVSNYIAFKVRSVPGVVAVVTIDVKRGVID